MNSSATIRVADSRTSAGLATSVNVGTLRHSQVATPIRILHVLDKLHLGGTEKVIAKLISRLDPDLFQHSICTLRGTVPNVRPWFADVDVMDAGCEGAGFQFNVLRLSRIMKTVRPTIVHSRNWGGIEGVFAARHAGVSVAVHSEHGYQLDMGNGLPLRQRLIRHAAYRCSTALFTVSRELRDYHAAQAWWSANSIAVLPNGVDTEKFSPSKEISSRTRQQLGIPQEALVVGCVGRLIALKDVRTLLLAVEKLAAEIPGLHVLVVGDGPESERLQAYVQGSALLKGRVCFTGVREDVADLLRAMDVFVLPSLMEGMSNVLLEAMATGVPAIATNVGGNPEILADSSSDYLFQPGNVGELVSKLSGLLHDRELLDKVGCMARARIEEKFSLQAMLERYTRFYSELARAPRAIKQTEQYVWN